MLGGLSPCAKVREWYNHDLAKRGRAVPSESACLQCGFTNIDGWPEDDKDVQVA